MMTNDEFRRPGSVHPFKMGLKVNARVVGYPTNNQPRTSGAELRAECPTSTLTFVRIVKVDGVQTDYRKHIGNHVRYEVATSLKYAIG